MSTTFTTLWQAVTWDIDRAGGLTAYVLLTLSVVIGLALSLHWQSPRWPRLINNELHNFVTLLALIFTAVHVLAVWIDPFTNFGWRAVFIPFATSYHPLPMALGIVGLYLGLAVGLSTWIRPWIGYAWWRRFHYVTLLLFALVAIHSITLGTDSKTPWVIALYAVSCALVAGLVVLRIVKSTQKKPHPAPKSQPKAPPQARELLQARGR
jgi:predicted ferric reductase